MRRRTKSFREVEMPRFPRTLRRLGIPPAERRLLRRAARLAPGPMQELVHANRLLNAGQFAPAAVAFEALANGARSAGIPRAPRLYFQAARASWHAGLFPAGMQLLRTALDLLAGAGAFLVVRQMVDAATAELNQLGRSQETADLRKYAEGLPGWGDAPAAQPAAPAHPALPTHCGQCGAAVRSDEVDWIDAQTAECAYCGSPVRGEAG
jgi:hypothetical protein